jgi:hypothetical protein
MRPPCLNLIDREQYPTAVYDGFSEPWFDSREALDEASSWRCYSTLTPQHAEIRLTEGQSVVWPWWVVRHYLFLNHLSQGYRPYSRFGFLSKNLAAVAGSIFPSSLSFLRATSSEEVSLCP